MCGDECTDICSNFSTDCGAYECSECCPDKLANQAAYCCAELESHCDAERFTNHKPIIAANEGSDEGADIPCV